MAHKSPKFFDGQVVRIKGVYSPKNKCLIGKIAKVKFQEWSEKDNDWAVYLDLSRWHYPAHALIWFLKGKKPYSVQENLEPVYNGNQVVSWDECAWFPTKLPMP